MKFHAGWLIANDPLGPRRIRLRDVSEYAFNDLANMTWVWVRAAGMPAEFPGNHIEALDRYFSEQELA